MKNHSIMNPYWPIPS